MVIILILLFNIYCVMGGLLIFFYFKCQITAEKLHRFYDLIYLLLNLRNYANPQKYKVEIKSIITAFLHAGEF